MLAILSVVVLAVGIGAFPEPVDAASTRAAVAAIEQEVVARIQIRGNVATADDEVRRLAGVAVGDPVGPETLDEVARRLRASKRFERVDVVRRFASLADPTQVVIVIVVDEGPVAVERTGDPDAPVKVVRTTRPVMFLPIVRFDDGYGFAYGARVSLTNLAGTEGRLSFPLTWGADKRAAIELDRELGTGRAKLSAGVAISRRTHPYFERDEDGGRAWVRVDRLVARSLRVGATGGWQHVAFLGSTDTFFHGGGDITFDNRLDPLLARNAAFARASWEHEAFAARDPVSRWELDGRAYIGLVGQSVLVVRGVRNDASGPLPAYLEPMLGGIATVRGFALGTAIGDTRAAASAELRLPLNSPLTMARTGVSAFVDAGTVYRHDQRFGDGPAEKGIGGSVWLSIAFVRLSVAVAHGLGSSTRAHFAGALAF